MANLNLDPAETTILLTGFSAAYKIFRGYGNVYDALSKFVMSIEVHRDSDSIGSLLLKLNQLSKDALNEPT